MNVSCPDCRSVFRVDPAKVPAAGVDVRCNVCGAVFAVASAEAPRPAETAPSVEAPELPSEVPTMGASAPSRASETVVAVAPMTELASGLAVGDTARSDTAPPTDGTVPRQPSPTPAPTPSEARPRPVNPYLNNSPELRARRLARALVSDLVAYNPQKREQGLRDGTLRQLFRDEIRKSWEEYVEQVGANVAENTPHFQDALNDVLAGGRRVF